MSYKVNTTVNIHKAPQENIGNALTVLAFVDSKSNLSKSGFTLLSSRSEFERVFADKYLEYSDTLKQAARTLEFGYNILAYNVRKCQYTESARVYSSGTDFVSRWFDTELPIEQFLTTLHSDKNLAVKFKLSDFTEGKYLLLEHTINGKASNLYVGAFKDGAPIISSVNYSNVPAPHEFTPTGNTEQDILKLKDILTKQEDYLMSYTNDGYVHLMFPYEFDTLGAGSANRVVTEYDPVFMYNYLNNVSDRNKILDIVSTYNSDIEDLAVEFTVNENKVYFISVFKYQNGTTIIDTENYYGTDLRELYQAVNGNSQYVRITPYSSIFPVGLFKLQQLHEQSSVTIKDYIEAIDAIPEILDGAYIAANIILEPDLDNITKDEQLQVQTVINKVFSVPSNMYIKFFTYIGDTNDILSCYFSNSQFSFRNRLFNSKMLMLYKLVSVDNLVDINEFATIQKDTRENPFYVLDPQEGFGYVNFPTVKVLFNKHIYDAYDMLIISCVNTQVNNTSATKNIYYFYQLTDNLSSYFTKHFGYNPNISVRNFVQNEDQVAVSIQYVPRDLSEVRSIDLLLDLYGGDLNG